MTRHVSYYFQDPCSPIMEMIVDLYTFIMFFLVGIVFLVTAGLFLVVYEFFLVSKFELYQRWQISRLVHCNWLEFGWTVTPLSVLLLIALPSFGLIYAMEEKFDFPLTVKIIGHQWYWEYEFVVSDQFSVEDKLFFYGCDSYLQPVDDLEIGDLRLLETDNILTFPLEVNLRLLTSSVDVIHSWALPSAGIKMDAVPGRLNQVNTIFNRLGLFYGQCSELCGVNHGFMPIVVKVLDFNSYFRVLNLGQQNIQISTWLSLVDH